MADAPSMKQYPIDNANDRRKYYDKYLKQQYYAMNNPMISNSNSNNNNYPQPINGPKISVIDQKASNYYNSKLNNQSIARAANLYNQKNYIMQSIANDPKYNKIQEQINIKLDQAAKPVWWG